MLLAVKKPESILLTVLALICGATTEQAGMMTIGLFVLLELEYIIRNKKINIRHIINIIMAAAGYATVIFSPGTSNRITTQPEISLSGFFRNFAAILQEHWFGTVNMYFYLIPILIFCSYWIWKYRDTCKAVKILCKPTLIAVWVLTAFNMVIKAMSILKTGNIFKENINYFIFMIWAIYAFLYFAVFAEAAILIFIKKKDSLPFITLILGLGSQFMMSISGKAYFRTCLPELIMFFIFEVYSVCYIKTDLQKKKNKYNKRILLICGTLVFAVCCVCNAYLSVQSLQADTVKTYRSLDSEEMTEFTNDLREAFIKYYSGDKSDWNYQKDIFDFSKY